MNNKNPSKLSVVLISALLLSSFSLALLTSPSVVEIVEASPDPAGWYNENWLYRKLITIDCAQVDADLDNYPFLFDNASPDFAKAMDNGDDFLFTDNDGVTKLPHEIENFDNADNHLIAHVKVPSVLSSENKSLYIYYGNPDAQNQENAVGVWSPNYAGVYHFNNDWNDSTSNDRDGTAVGDPTHVTGKIAKCGDFSSDKIEISNALSNLDNFTIELWANPDALGADRGIFGPYTAPQQIIFYWNNPNGWRAIVERSGSSISGYGGGGSAGDWEHIVLRSVRNDNEYVYDNGSLITSGGGQDADVDSTADPNTIGWTDGTRYWDGKIDEVRISDVARSAGWITTSFNNQSSPATFYSVGNEQTPPAQIFLYLRDDYPTHGQDYGLPKPVVDVGSLLANPPTEVETRYCAGWVQFDYDEESIDWTNLENIYYHFWWKMDDDNVTVGWCDNAERESWCDDNVWLIAPDNSHSDVNYYHLSTCMLTNIGIAGKENRFDFSIKFRSIGAENPFVLSSPNQTSFVIFNLPSDDNLKATDSDSDGVSDYNELFVLYTNPQDNDTDDDGYLDGDENKADTNPNDYLDCGVRLHLPVYNSLIDNGMPYFEWRKVGASNHRLLVDNDSDFSSPEENRMLSDNYYTIADDNSLSETIYYWKIVELGDDNESATWSFMVCKRGFEWINPENVENFCDEEPGHPTSDAIDDNTSTYWNHNTSDHSHWIEFDLGEEMFIVAVRLYQGGSAYRWGGQHGFRVYASDNLVDWGEPIWTGMLYESGWTATENFLVKKRYVRLYSMENFGLERMYEMQVLAGQYSPSVENIRITTMDNTSTDNLAVETPYKFWVEVRDPDNLSDVNEVQLKIYRNTLSENDPDHENNHYDFKWIRNDNWYEVGPDNTDENHIVKENCVAGQDNLTVDNFVFCIRLDADAENGTWSAWVWIVDNENIQDNREFQDLFIVSVGAAPVYPTQPQLYWPGNGSEVTSTKTPTLQWENALYADNHRVLLDDDSNPDVGPLYDQTIIGDNQWTTPTLTEDQQYWWKVIAQNENGDNDSVTWNFTINTEAPPSPPGQPTLYSPSDNVTIYDNTPTFIWTKGSGADSHRLMVDNDSGFSSAEIDNSGLTDNYFTAESELAYDNYYWKVIAHNDDGDTSSTTWNFELTEVEGVEFTFYSGACDGDIRGGPNADYQTVRDAATGTVDNGSSIIDVGQIFLVTQFRIYRGFVFFDTSSLPDNCTITYAVLSLYGYGSNLDNNFNVIVQTGGENYPHCPLEVGDYNRTHYSGGGGSFYTSMFITDGWNDITLDNDGMGWISKTGTTKFCLRSSNDNDNIEPTGYEIVQFCSSENASYKPRLTVVFSNNPPVVQDLKTEGETDPTGLPFNASPMFSWDYSDDDNDNQSHYEIWVGTNSGDNDMWGSGQVASDNENVAYAGTALSPAATYYVQVRVRDGWEWSSWETGTFRMGTNYGIVLRWEENNEPATVNAILTSYMANLGAQENSITGGQLDNLILNERPYLMEVVPDNENYWRARVPTTDNGTITFWLTADSTQYTFTLSDLVGGYGPPNGILHIHKWMGENYITINSDYWAPDLTCSVYLIQGERYHISAQGEFVPRRYVGDMVMTSDTERIVQVAPVEAELVSIFEYIYWAAWRVSGTTIKAEYQDNLNNTLEANVTIYYENGDLAIQYQPDSDWFIVTWTGADENGSYNVVLEVEHDNYGSLEFSTPIGTTVGPPGVDDTDNPFDLPAGLTMAGLGSIIFIIVVGLAFDALRVQMGVLAIAMATLFCWYMGFLPLPGPFDGMFTAVLILFIAVLFAITWTRRSR